MGFLEGMIRQVVEAMDMGFLEGMIRRTVEAMSFLEGTIR